MHTDIMVIHAWVEETLLSLFEKRPNEDIQSFLTCF